MPNCNGNHLHNVGHSDSTHSHHGTGLFYSEINQNSHSPINFQRNLVHGNPINSPLPNQMSSERTQSSAHNSYYQGFSSPSTIYNPTYGEMAALAANATNAQNSNEVNMNTNTLAMGTSNVHSISTTRGSSNKMHIPNSYTTLSHHSRPQNSPRTLLFSNPPKCPSVKLITIKNVAKDCTQSSRVARAIIADPRKTVPSPSRANRVRLNAGNDMAIQASSAETQFYFPPTVPSPSYMSDSTINRISPPTSKTIGGSTISGPDISGQNNYSTVLFHKSDSVRPSRSTKKAIRPANLHFSPLPHSPKEHNKNTPLKTLQPFHFKHQYHNMGSPKSDPLAFFSHPEHSSHGAITTDTTAFVPRMASVIPPNPMLSINADFEESDPFGEFITKMSARKTVATNTDRVKSCDERSQTDGPYKGRWRLMQKYPKIEELKKMYSDDQSDQKRRFHLCEQTRVLIARVFEYNKRMSEELGTEATGTPWQHPLKMTAEMCGFTNNTVKQCADIGDKLFKKCTQREESMQDANGEVRDQLKLVFRRQWNCSRSPSITADDGFSDDDSHFEEPQLGSSLPTNYSDNNRNFSPGPRYSSSRASFRLRSENFDPKEAAVHPEKIPLSVKRKRALDIEHYSSDSKLHKTDTMENDSNNQSHEQATFSQSNCNVLKECSSLLEEIVNKACNMNENSCFHKDSGSHMEDDKMDISEEFVNISIKNEEFDIDTTVISKETNEADIPTPTSLGSRSPLEDPDVRFADFKDATCIRAPSSPRDVSSQHLLNDQTTEEAVTKNVEVTTINTDLKENVNPEKSTSDSSNGTSADSAPSSNHANIPFSVVQPTNDSERVYKDLLTLAAKNNAFLSGLGMYNPLMYNTIAAPWSVPIFAPNFLAPPTSSIYPPFTVNPSMPWAPMFVANPMAVPSPLFSPISSDGEVPAESTAAEELIDVESLDGDFDLNIH